MDTVGESERGRSETETTEDSETDPAVRIFAAGGLGLLPALGAEVLVLFLLVNAMGIVFLLTLVGFAYLFYRAESITAMAGRMFFWLGMEAFLVPLALFGFAIRTNEMVIVSLIWVFGSAVVTVPVGIVLYLISRRLGD